MLEFQKLGNIIVVTMEIKRDNLYSKQNKTNGQSNKTRDCGTRCVYDMTRQY